MEPRVESYLPGEQRGGGSWMEPQSSEELKSCILDFGELNTIVAFTFRHLL